MRSYIKKSHSELIFLLLQTILYLTFLFLDLTGRSTMLSAGIKYTIIILCFCYALLYGGAGKSNAGVVCFANHSLFLQAGMFFTLISDLFILLLDRYFYGVLTFIIVQQLYGFRLLLIRDELDGRKDEKSWLNRCRNILNIRVVRKARHSLFYLFLMRLLIQLTVSAIICLLLAGAGVVMEGLLAASVLYFIGILTNTVSAVRTACLSRKRYNEAGHDTVHFCARADQRECASWHEALYHGYMRTWYNNQLYAAGMLLFLLCDINVGLFNLSGFIAVSGELSSAIYAISGILMWTFYAPSQVLIALSSRSREEIVLR